VLAAILTVGPVAVAVAVAVAAAASMFPRFARLANKSSSPDMTKP